MSILGEKDKICIELNEERILDPVHVFLTYFLNRFACLSN